MKFSIIIPFYNVEPYIEECIRSVAEQNYPKDDFEIICVDDCSPDDSQPKVRNLMREYPNISLLCHDENKHQGGARNTGLRKAKGDWILFLDSDDAFADSSLLSNFSALIQENPDADFIKTDEYFPFVKDYKKEIKNVKLKREISVLSGKEYLLSDPFMPHVVLGCYNRNFLLSNNEFFREHVFFEDTDWSLKVYLAAKKVVHVSYPFYAYRVNLTSTTQNPRVSTFRDMLTSLNECYLLSKTADLECAGKILQRVEDIVLHAALMSRDYKLAESREAFRYLNSMPVMNLNLYSYTTFKNRIFLRIINKCPALLYTPVRVITLLKRKLKSLAK